MLAGSLSLTASLAASSSPARLASGDRVRLDLTLGRSRRRIRAVAVVRWVREIYDGEVFEIGLEFTALSAEAEFALMDHVFGVRDGSGT